MPTRYRVVVEIATAAADVERVVAHHGTVEPIDAGSRRLVMQTDTLDWPTTLLASVGTPFTVIDPPELAEEVRRIGELFPRGAAGPPVGIP